jgi:hypothetical protein
VVSSYPLSFIDEPIEVHFEHAPMLEKAPPCPDAFTWRGEVYPVLELIEEWHDFRRRGKGMRNMQPAHAARATIKGSWGVGRYCFRVRSTERRIFEIYYDRAPGDAGDRKGHWFLLGERGEKPAEE